MANFYKVQPRATSFLASLFSRIGWKNIGEVRLKKGRFFIYMKNNKIYELTLVEHENKN